jgi:hypothetical protein
MPEFFKISLTLWDSDNFNTLPREIITIPLGSRLHSAIEIPGRAPVHLRHDRDRIIAGGRRPALLFASRGRIVRCFKCASRP